MNWWFEMFSDSGYAELCRSLTKERFNLGRNTIALIEPAAGVGFTFGGFAILLNHAGVNKDNPLLLFIASLFLFFLAVAVLGMLPIPLPRPMYPEWQMDRRRRLAAQAASEAAADEHATAPGALTLTNYQSTPPQDTDHSSYTDSLPIPDDGPPPRSHSAHNSTPHSGTRM